MIKADLKGLHVSSIRFCLDKYDYKIEVLQFMHSVDEVTGSQGPLLAWRPQAAFLSLLNLLSALVMANTSLCFSICQQKIKI